MYRVVKKQDSNVISMTRGDTAIFNLALKMNGEDYTLGEEDTCVLTVKTKVTTDEIVLQKHLVKGQFIIEPSDTKDLKYGTYKYDIQVTTAEGIVDTVVTPTDFVIEPEVTW